MSALEPKATILVVDDEPDNRFALSHVLAELEQRIVEAASGEDALRFLLGKRGGGGGDFGARSHDPARRATTPACAQ